MLLLSYDISKTKTRTKLAKFLERYGDRVQYSVWRIDNSPRLLRIIRSEIEGRFAKLFQNTDSVYIFRVCEGCQGKTVKYGYARHEDEDAVILT